MTLTGRIQVQVFTDALGSLEAEVASGNLPLSEGKSFVVLQQGGIHAIVHKQTDGQIRGGEGEGYPLRGNNCQLGSLYS